MNNSATVLPGTELDLTMSPYDNKWVISRIDTDGAIGNYAAQAAPSAIDGVQAGDIAVGGAYSAADEATISTMPALDVQGRFNKLYNNGAGYNVRCVLEPA